MNDFLFKRAIRKAKKSSCRYKIAAIGLDKKNNLLGVSYNIVRFHRKGGGIHAEQNLIIRYGKRLKTIIICRIGQNNSLLPISACDKCKEMADKLGIRIVTIDERETVYI